METLRWIVDFLSNRKMEAARQRQAAWLALRSDRAVVARNIKTAFSHFFGKLSLTDEELEEFRQANSQAKSLFGDDVNFCLERVLEQFCKAKTCRFWATNSHDLERQNFYRRKADEATLKLSLLSEAVDQTLERYLSYNSLDASENFANS